MTVKHNNKDSRKRAERYLYCMIMIIFLSIRVLKVCVCCVGVRARRPTPSHHHTCSLPHTTLRHRHLHTARRAPYIHLLSLTTNKMKMTDMTHDTWRYRYMWYFLKISHILICLGQRERLSRDEPRLARLCEAVRLAQTYKHPHAHDTRRCSTAHCSQIT